MEYEFCGRFIEACDCFELCPCWVDDEPDEGHCTGLVAWDIEKGKINGVAVAGNRVAAVTSHGGGRRTRGATTVLYVDAATEDARKRLVEAFSTEHSDTRTDPLNALMEVTGLVVAVIEDQPIGIEDLEDGCTTVRIGRGDAAAVTATVAPLVFEGETDPLTLRRTALHRELRIKDEATAQRSSALSIAVPALPNGYIEAKARSGMRGEFAYST